MGARKDSQHRDDASLVSSTSPPDLSIMGTERLDFHPSGIATSTPAPVTAPAPSPSLASLRAHLRQSNNAPPREQDEERKLVAQMGRFGNAPYESLKELSLYIYGTGWRSYTNYIGQRVGYAGFTEAMRSRVMSNQLLVCKIRQLAQMRADEEQKLGILGDWHGHAAGSSILLDKKATRTRELERQLREVAERIANAMIAKMDSIPIARAAYYPVTALLTRAYHQGIHVSSAEVLRLRETARKAARDGQSIVFLPSHRSHIDYISLHILCFRLGLSAPTVVAGDNLNFPLVGPFLQALGAMWIRRSFDGSDPLYSTVVQAYVDTLLQQGLNFECFIEGTRSRTGKLLSPKLGILSYVLDSVLSGRVKDCVVVPVSTQYDKVVEVDSYISELLGQPKTKENLANFLTGSSGVLGLKLGRVDVRFHEPWSLRRFCDEQMDRYVRAETVPGPVASDKVDREWTAERRVRLLRTLGYKVLSEINDVSVVMPTALIGTVLLTLRGRGVGKSELIRRVEWLVERVKRQGGRVASFAGVSTETVVERGLDVLGPKLVGVVHGLPEETYYAVDRFQLSFYRNMTIHLFILEAVVCAGLYTRVKLGGAAEYQRMGYAELREYVLFLSQLFRGEFIFPAEGLDVNIEKALHRLEADNVLSVVRNMSGDVEFVELSAHERDSGRENYDFYCFLIWPFVEASWLGAVSLMMLAPPADYDGDGWLDMKRVQDHAQLLGKTLYHQGDLSYFEAVNKETLKNGYERFREEGIIIVTKDRDGTDTTEVRLANDWMPRRSPVDSTLLPEGPLWGFADSISQSRREGKNRRDGNTVIKRVLKLADVCGRQLFEDAKSDHPLSTKAKEDASKGPRRRRGIAETAAKL